MAIVPVVISMALIVAVMDGQGLDQRARALSAAGSISAAVTAAVHRTEGMVLGLSSDRSLGHLITDPEPPGNLDRVTDGLLALGDAGGTLVAAARVADASGRDRLVSSGGAVSVPSGGATEDPALIRSTLALDAGDVFQGRAFKASNGEIRVPLAAPLIEAGSSAAPVGVLVVEISLPEVMRQVGAQISDPGSIALVVDQSSGAVLGDSRLLAGGEAPNPGPRDLQ
jgi:hypothetical protein